MHVLPVEIRFVASGMLVIRPEGVVAIAVIDGVMDRYRYLSRRTLENRVQKPSTRTRAIFARHLLGRYFLSTAQATEYCGSTTLAILITALWPRSW